jgi:hypothetical protein
MMALLPQNIETAPEGPFFCGNGHHFGSKFAYLRT